MRIPTLILLCLSPTVFADEAIVAVATNFNPLLEQLLEEFEATSGHSIEISNGSTGKLYAQILHGAPYDVFLAADQARPALLERSGRGVAGSRFTYAIGKLALWSANEALILVEVDASLQQPNVRRIAIANPQLAPYSSAAEDVLKSLRIYDELSGKLVMGENVGQAFSMAATRNADMAIVALSHVLQTRLQVAGTYLEIPAELHAPIRQDAILLEHGAGNAAALAFLAFLESNAARARIASAGYGSE